MNKNISSILRKIREQNNITQDKLSQMLGCNISTIRKIEGGKYNVGKKILYALYDIKLLEPSDKKYIKELIDIKYKKINQKQSKSNEVRELLDIIDSLKKENEELLKNKTINNSPKIKSNRDFFRVNSFKNDYETTNRIIKELWDLNDVSSSHFSELNLLLSINSIEENEKLKKGIYTVSKNLQDMGNKLLKYIEKNQDIIID